MKRACPARPARILQANSRVVQPPAVDDLDRAAGQGDPGQRGNRIDHHRELVAEALDLLERRAPPRHQASHHERRRHEGEQGHQVERLVQPEQGARRAQEVRQAHHATDRGHGRRNEVSRQGHEDDDDQVERRGPEVESIEDDRQHRQTGDTQPAPHAGPPESLRHAAVHRSGTAPESELVHRPPRRSALHAVARRVVIPMAGVHPYFGGVRRLP